MYELLQAGFDTLDVAFAGVIPTRVLSMFKDAQQEAANWQKKVLVIVGPGKVPMKVASHGMRGGYAYLTDTGPLGAKSFFKRNSDPSG